MGIKGIDHHRAGRLGCDEASVVLAEVSPGSDPPAFNVSFNVDDLDAANLPPEVEVVTSTEPTPRGTRWVRVRDPDGRVYSLEENSGGR
ncbi:MAG: hypothetical protein MUP76_08795 [Acidimicrobiia bacterium]|nr:hypothetical protein [Acidimicrobiia bacterium]